MEKPDHLRPATAPVSRTEWMRTHAAGLVALGLGLVAFALAAMTQHGVWSSPDWRVSVPGFVVTLAASVASLVRREKSWLLWPIGLGLAAAAIVLGWFLMIMVIVGATLIVMLIVHALM